MGVFSDLINVDKNGDIFYNQWIEWEHFLVSNKPDVLRKLMRKLIALFGHCLNCTALDGCYLLDSNRPEQPLHTNCDCNKINIDFNKVKANANSDLPIIKLSKYIFSGDINSKGKQSIFQSWEYTINDVNDLKRTFEKQAKENYINGKYVLKKLDEFGQRLAIPIKLKENEFYSGWMLYPEGKIRNITPFGGWIK